MKYNKLLYFAIICIILIQFVSADLCTERSTSPCEVMTPNISCSGNYYAYDLSDGSSTNAAMENVASGIYNFTLTKTEGSYVIVLCSGHATDIEFISSSEVVAVNTNISTILSDTNAILVDTSTTIPAQITQNSSAIMTYLEDTIYAKILTMVTDVWGALLGYEDPDGSDLTANQTVVRIAQYTEEGGW